MRVLGFSGIKRVQITFMKENDDIVLVISDTH